jgi:hypothetical protein
MNGPWRWVAIVVVSLCILGLLAAGRESRQAYWFAHGTAVQRAIETEQPINRLLQRSPGR